MPLSRAEFNTFCGRLPATSFVEQWGGAQVWKVGGKVFAMAWFEKGRAPEITFKVSDIGWEVLREAPGCRPATPSRPISTAPNKRALAPITSPSAMASVGARRLLTCVQWWRRGRTCE